MHNEGVLHFPQIPASPSDSDIPWTLLGVLQRVGGGLSYLSAEMQLAYSTDLAYRVVIFWVKKNFSSKRQKENDMFIHFVQKKI